MVGATHQIIHEVAKDLDLPLTVHAGKQMKERLPSDVFLQF